MPRIGHKIAKKREEKEEIEFWAQKKTEVETNKSTFKRQLTIKILSFFPAKKRKKNYFQIKQVIITAIDL